MPIPRIHSLCRLAATCTATALALLSALPATAGPDEGAYAGLSLSSARNKGSGDQSSSVGTALGLTAGYRFASGWSAELSHADMSGFLSCFKLLGQVRHCEDVQRTTAVSGIHHASLGSDWTLLLRAGLARTQTEVIDQQVSGGRPQSRHETEAVLGLGVQRQLGSATRVRAEFQTLTKTQVKQVGVGIHWLF